MDIIFDKSLLVAGLRAILPNTARDQNFGSEHASRVLIEANASGARFTSTSNDLEISANIEATVGMPGFCSLPARKLHDIARASTADTVHIRIDGKSFAHLRIGSSRYTLTCLEARDFPRISPSASQPSAKISVTAKALQSALESAAYAISTDANEMRLALQGMLLQCEGDRLNCVGTDGQRLARTSAGIQGHSGSGPSEILLPRSSVPHLVALLQDAKSDEAVTVELFDRVARLRVGEVTWTTKLLDSAFPNYQAVIPEDRTCQALVDRESLYRAVERARILAHERKRELEISITSSTIRLVTRVSGEEVTTEELSTSTAAPVDFTCKLNIDFLFDALRNLPSGDIRIVRPDMATAPVSISPEGQASPLHLIMPMR